VKAFVLILLIIVAVILWDRYRQPTPAGTDPDEVTSGEVSQGDEDASPPKPKGFAKWSDQQ